jgi:hypothetical protein
MTNASISAGSSSWVLSSESTEWGMDIINATTGEVSYFKCGKNLTSAQSAYVGAPLNPMVALLAIASVVMVIARRKRE